MRDLIATMVLVCVSPLAVAAAENGMPFGRITYDDLDNLGTFARANGVDLLAELDAAYEKKDTEALGRAFQFCTKFDKLDANGHYATLVRSLP